MKATSEKLTTSISAVESGSSNRAAEQLGQVNSAVNRAVKKLEMEPGVSLLDRTARQLSLTEEGERYFRRVQSVLQEMAAAESETMETYNTPYGLLRIDAATPVALYLLMPLIRPFRERYPEITLSLISFETIISSVERKVSVVMRAGTLTDSSLCAGPLFNSHREVITSPDYTSHYGKPETIDDLKQHICLGFTEPASLNTWSTACSDGQLHKVKYGLSSNNEETLKRLRLSGNGIACLSDYMIGKETTRGKLVELMADEILPVEMPFSAVYYSNRAVGTRIRAFIDFLSEHVKTAPGGTAREA